MHRRDDQERDDNDDGASRSIEVLALLWVGSRAPRSRSPQADTRIDDQIENIDSEIGEDNDSRNH